MRRHRSESLRLLAAALLVLGVPTGTATAQDTDLFTVAVPPNVMLIVDNSGSMNNVVWHPAFDPAATPTCANWDNDTTYIFNSTLTLTRCGNTRTLYPDPSIGGWTRITGRYLNWIFSDEADSYQGDLASTTNGTRSPCLVAEGESPNYSKYRRSRITAAKEVLREVICQVNDAGDVRFGLAQFYDSSDPEGGYVKVAIDDYDASHGAAIETFIEDLAGEAWTPLSETLYNVYRYFQSRSDPMLGKDDTTAFPAYDLELDGDVDASNAPGTPVQYSCQRNFVIIITDGEPTKDDFDGMDRNRFRDDLVGDYNPDNTLPEAGDETPGDACPFCNETTFYLDDLAKFMREKDFQLDFAGDQTIDVYTVGFTTAPPANQLLAKTAQVGNGLFFQSNNAEELADAIIDAVTDIIDKAQAFTSATVPASRTTDGDNFYASFFLPKADTPWWEGHLKNFTFTAGGEIVTPDGRCATGLDITETPPCTGGQLRSFEDAHWDVADEIPDPDDRKLYVEAGATSIFTQPGEAKIAPGDEAAVAAALGFQAGVDINDEPYDSLTVGTDPDDLAVALVDALRGCEFGSMPCDPRTNDAGDKIYMGDIFHSNPVVVGSPNSPVNEPSYQIFATNFRERTRVIYAGANDGFVHGFNAGDWKNFQSDGVTPLVPPRHDRGTGEELMGFMPAGVRDRIKDFPKETTFPRTMETVDGSPIVADVWFYRNVVSGLLTGTNPTLTPEDAEYRRWRTVLMGGLRNGGESYYALDITDPTATAAESSSTYPRYLWGFPCDDCANAVNGSTAGEAAWMGNTWSEPVITRVRVKSESGPDPNGYDRWVAIFGAGYHPHGDPNGSDYRVPTDAGFTPKGRAIYMVDITTGKVLARKVFDPTAGALSLTKSPQERIKEFHYAFASAPAVFDLNFDGYADVIYIGDLGGNLWKWVVTNVGDDPINNSIQDNDPNQPNWPFRRIFRAGTSLEGTATPTPGEQLGAAWDPSVHYQSFFFPPTGALRQGKLVLAFGAGERANPKGPASEFGDGDLTNNNHYYVMKDAGGLEKGAADPLAMGDSLDESDMADFDAPTPLSCAAMHATKAGYFITARDAEKFVTNSVVFLGKVFTGSFLPPDPADASNVCNASGSAFLYVFDLDCGVGIYTSGGTPSDQRRKAIGSGIPTRPRVSVGGLNQGGSGGGCTSKVVVITSDGYIDNDCPGPLPTSGVNIRSWRQR